MLTVQISITTILLALNVQAYAEAPVRAYVLCEAGFDHRNCLVVSRSGKLLSNALLGLGDADSYPRFKDGMLAFEADSEPSLHGYVNDQGRIAVAAKYRVAEAFSEARAKVCLDIPTEPAAFEQTPAQARSIDKQASPACGYIDPKGREVIAPRPEWQHATRFQDGRALVRGSDWVDFMGESIGYRSTAKPWTVIGINGQRVLGPDQHALNHQKRSFAERRVEPEITGEFRSGVAPFRLGQSNRWGLMDAKGKIIAPAIYSGRSQALNGAITLAERDLPGQDDIAEFQRESEAGLLNAKGRFIAFAQLFKGSILDGQEIYVDELYPHVDGSTVFEVNSEYIAIVDADLKLLLAPLRAFLMDCYGKTERCIASEKLLPISITPEGARGGMGPYHPIYIRPDGTKVIERKLDAAKIFSEGLACVETDAATEVDAGFIDQKGRWVIEPQFQKCEDDFYGGRAIVRLNESHEIGNTWISDTALIDRRGKILAKYSELLLQLKRQQEGEKT
jgi:WG containing repeat